MLKKIISQGSSSSYEDEVNQSSYSSRSENVSSMGTESEQTAMIGSMNSKNVLSNDVKIKGSIEFANDLIIDGSIDGEVSSNGEGNLVVGENASIIGEIKTKCVIVHGKIKGNITVNERCELKASAHLEGDIKALSLSIEEGARFIGNSSVGSKAAELSANKSKSFSSDSSSSSKKSSSSKPSAIEQVVAAATASKS